MRRSNSDLANLSSQARPPAMSFLSLPREIRDRIFQELLYSAKGIKLVYSHAKDDGSEEADSESGDDLDSEEEMSDGQEEDELESEEGAHEDRHHGSDEDQGRDAANDEDEEDDQDDGDEENGNNADGDDAGSSEDYFPANDVESDDSNDRLVSEAIEDATKNEYDERGIKRSCEKPSLCPRTTISTAIFCVNRQISAEALQTFYQNNIFIFDTSVGSAIGFIQQTLSPAARLHIRHLGLTSESVDYQELFREYHWRALTTYMKLSLNIFSVTIHIPYNIIMGFTGNRRGWTDWLMDLHHLRDSLLGGGFQKLRIAYI